jgi:HlyD family secretion protein
LVVFPGEENLSRLTVGASALASADAFSDRVIPAVVSLIAPMVDPAQGTVEVRLTMVDPPEYLLPEMTVSVNIETGRKTGAAVVPEDAVQGLGTGSPWVGVVEDGLLQRVDIVVGLRATGYLEVVSGLGTGASVALSPRLEDIGRRVRIVASEG